MPAPVRQSDMDAIFAVTDALGIHRESVTVPLAKRDPGEVRSVGGQIRITLPESRPAADWADTVLREELARLGYE